MFNFGAKSYIAVFIFTSVCLSSGAMADSVYKWTDENGKVHFSTKAPSKNAKPADLPPIMKGEMKLAKTKLVSCEGHGGINCQSGADADGSVICFDGFTGSSARFRFNCNSPKLDISDISDISETGAFTVFVRNAKSVAAKKPKVTWNSIIGKTETLQGPEEVEPFGMAEFTFQSSDKTKESIGPKPTIADIKVTCENCPL